MNEGIVMRVCSITHRGLLKERNEDRSVVKEFEESRMLLAVADGLGGHAAGELAAEIAAESLNAFKPDSQKPEDQLMELVHATNMSILDRSSGNPSLDGMATTLTVAFVEEMTAHWAQVGDSRLYIFREGELVQITDDHTIAGLLLRSGEIDSEEARLHPLRSILTSCLGRDEFEMDIGSLELDPGDLLLLSTDGLHDRVDEEKIISILRLDSDLNAKMDALLQAALDSGGNDNITAVAMEI